MDGHSQGLIAEIFRVGEATASSENGLCWFRESQMASPFTLIYACLYGQGVTTAWDACPARDISRYSGNPWGTPIPGCHHIGSGAVVLQARHMLRGVEQLCGRLWKGKRCHKRFLSKIDLFRAWKVMWTHPRVCCP